MLFKEKGKFIERIRSIRIPTTRLFDEAILGDQLLQARLTTIEQLSIISKQDDVSEIITELLFYNKKELLACMSNLSRYGQVYLEEHVERILKRAMTLEECYERIGDKKIRNKLRKRNQRVIRHAEKFLNWFYRNSPCRIETILDAMNFRTIRKDRP